MGKGKLEIVYRKVADLKPSARNARTHSENQIQTIAASIREFGFTNPVLIDEGDEIIAGHGRVLAAELAGLVEVPTITLAGLTEIQKRAYLLADNKLALNSGWDKDLLALEVTELADANFEMGLLGWDETELDVMTGNVPPGQFPSLGGKKEPDHIEVNFILHNEQSSVVQAALSKAKKSRKARDAGAFGDLNKNSNGNALAYICGRYLTEGDKGGEGDAG